MEIRPPSEAITCGCSAGDKGPVFPADVGRRIYIECDTGVIYKATAQGWQPAAVSTSGTVSWGSVGGTISNQTDLQAVLNGKAATLGADDNYVTDAEKGSLHFPGSDNQDLSGYSLTSHNHTGIYEPTKGGDDNFVTDAQLVVIGNTSNTNTGDQTLSGLGGVATTVTVNGHALSGNVSVTATDVGLGSVNNTTDVGKPVSTAQQTALDLKANSISPSFVTPALGTPASGNLASCTFPVLNQSTSGTSANITGVLNATSHPALTGDVTCSSGATATAIKASVSLTTPVIGVATGTSLAVTGALTSSGAGIGYATGAGGTVTQATARTTGVSLSKLSGTITMFSAAVAAAASSSFVLTNTFIAATDMVLAYHNSVTNACSWVIETIAAAGTCTFVVKNISAASITEATPVKFLVIKAVSA